MVPMAHTYSEEIRQHAAALMEEFDAIMLWMQRLQIK